MFFYKEDSAVDAWANATVFTDNFNQALDTTNNWDTYNGNGGNSGVLQVAGGNLLLVGAGGGSRVSVGLKNSSFTNLTNSKATRLQAKVFIDKEGYTANVQNTNNQNWASLRLRSTFSFQGNFLKADGYKIIFKKDENGVNRIQFMTGDTTNNATEQSGGTRYNLDTFQFDTWYNMRIDTFPTATTEVVRIYKETTIDSGIWTLLGEYEFNQSSNDCPKYSPQESARIYLHSQTYNSGVIYAYFDDFKSYIMDAPATVPPA